MYIRKDCEDGVLTDNNDINYYKATQREEIISNYMLGDYNQDGEYILDDNIINELVAMPKCVINSFSNLVFCESLVVTEFIEKEKFLVKTITDPNNINIKISTLEVMESVNKVEGCIINTVSTVLAQYIDKDSPEYVNKMYEAFNIIEVEEFSQEQAEKYARGFVSLRRKYIYSINQLCLKNVNQASKQAYLDKIQILKASGKVGEETLKLYEERLKQNPLVASHNDYKALNELLDSAIEVHKEELEPIMPQIRQTGEKYAEKVTEIENHANLNLKTMQKSYGASATITTQQAIVEKNKSQKQNNIIKIISQQAKETTAEKTQSNQEEIIIDQKSEKNKILKTLFGSVLANQEQAQKEDKKDNVKENKKPQPQTQKESNQKEETSNQAPKKKQENTYKPQKQESVKPIIKETNNKEKPKQTEETNISSSNNQTTQTDKSTKPEVNKQINLFVDSILKEVDGNVKEQVNIEETVKNEFADNVQQQIKIEETIINVAGRTQIKQEVAESVESIINNKNNKNNKNNNFAEKIEEQLMEDGL